ncbi:LpqB family beta-propeller domain-containing protein [Tersicoccus solisilvae]|uniref:LpqB family beta-propeller domain-containing protein n=1 Tax=Tersicoccus solisilvae TaxID=1882339 RepID=UPI001664BCFD|nr:LpqB family beta-propeller domain-containing protein [Tersicoccus solisilvae]
MSARRSRRVLVLVLAALLLLTGCSSIPTSGPVGLSNDSGNAGQQNQQGPAPSGPQENGSPQAIVQGFIRAGVGSADEYAVARSYLTPALSSTWKPDQRTLVLSSAPRVVTTPSASTVRLVMAVTATVDDQGIYRNAAEGATESLDVTLQKVDGQWRIGKVPDGIMLQVRDFGLLFDAYSLAFYDPTYTYAVPDVRWFVRGPRVTTSLVRVLLNGPADYLKGAVVSAFPEGTTLNTPSVPIVSGAAEVDLPQQVLDSSDQKQRERMLNQLSGTLVGVLDSISSVRLLINQRPLDIDAGEAARSAPVKEKQVPASQVAVVRDELVLYQGGGYRPIDGIGSVAADKPIDPAMSYDQRRFAYLSSDRRRLLSTSTDGTRGTVFTGTALTRPSFDPFDWLWTADGSGAGLVHTAPAARPGGGVNEVSAPWLRGRTITSLRLSRDGARALIVTVDDGKSSLWLSGVRRAADGTPRELTSALPIRTAHPVNTAVWLGDTEVVVMAASDKSTVTPEVLSLSGQSQELAPVRGATSLAGGNGTQEIYLQYGQELLVRVDTTWSNQATGVLDTAFAG